MSRIVVVRKMLEVHEIKDSNDTITQKLGNFATAKLILENKSSRE